MTPWTTCITDTDRAPVGNKNQATKFFPGFGLRRHTVKSGRMRNFGILWQLHESCGEPVGFAAL